MKVKHRKGLVAVAAALVVAIAAMGAYAYWTQDGAGSGTATTGDTVAVTVNQDSAVTGLYPGGPAQALSGDFDNPNPGLVKVGSVTAVVSGTSNIGCTAADFTIGGSAPVDAEIPSGTNVGSWSGLTISMNNLSSNQDACKNVTVDIDYTVSAGA